MADPRQRGPRGRPRRPGIPSVIASTREVDVATARALAASKHERKAGAVLELDLDKCKLEFGETNEFGTCTATGEPCYKTFGTCKDKENYVKGVYTWRFCTRGMQLPPGEPMRPYIPLSGISIASSEIDPNKGLAIRSRTTVQLVDEPDSDVEGDPYVLERAAPAQGTFFTRLLARSKNYAGRPARLRRGFVYIDPSVAPLTESFWDTFETEHLIIESIKGPDSQGNFRVELSDAIRILDHVQIPPPTDGKLKAALPAVSNAGTAQSGGASTIQLAAAASAADDAYNGQEVFITGNTGAGQRRVISDYVGATRTATVSVNWAVNPNATSTYEVTPLSLTLDAGKGEKYPDPAGTGGMEFIAIGDEVIRYTSKVGDVLSWPDGTYRAQFETERDDHDVDDGVQICEAVIEMAPATVLRRYCNKGGFGDELIDLAGLESEAADWLAVGAQITVCITAPEKASDLVRDLLLDLNLFAWWDSVARLFRFKANMPAITSTIAVLTDDELQLDATQVETLDSERITRAAIYYDPRSATVNLKEAKNFKRGAVAVDIDAESANEYGDVRQDTRYSRWFTADNSTFANARTTRLVGRRRDAPLRIKFQLDPRNAVNLGDLRDLTSRAIVDEAGAPKIVRVRVTKKRDQLTHLELEARTTNFGRRYGFIAPVGLPNYDAASVLQRAYAFIADADGVMSDGTEAYVVI